MTTHELSCSNSLICSLAKVRTPAAAPTHIPCIVLSIRLLIGSCGTDRRHLYVRSRTLAATQRTNGSRAVWYLAPASTDTSQTTRDTNTLQAVAYTRFQPGGAIFSFPLSHLFLPSTFLPLSCVLAFFFHHFPPTSINPAVASAAAPSAGPGRAWPNNVFWRT